MDIRWTWYRWQDVSADTLYALLRLRSEIFVVEQNCVYADMDGYDPQCMHLCAHNHGGAVVACLRLLPPGVKYPLPSIGRLVVAAGERRRGLARTGMLQALERCTALYGAQPVWLTAQQYLEAFYQSLGFVTVGTPYLEDGIPHINMQRG